MITHFVKVLDLGSLDLERHINCQIIFSLKHHDNYVILSILCCTITCLMPHYDFCKTGFGLRDKRADLLEHRPVPRRNRWGEEIPKRKRSLDSNFRND